MSPPPFFRPCRDTIKTSHNQRVGASARKVLFARQEDKDGDNSSSTSMIILDILDDGAYYVWKPEGEKAVSETTVRDFLAAYKAKTLERHQLG